MIIGIGTDIVMISRIESTIEKFGERFLQRIFTDYEREYCDKAIGMRRLVRYANRYAAKEACFKAIGVKVGISWQDIEVKNDGAGKPHLWLHGAADLAINKPYKLHLSLTDERDYCLAFVIIEKLVE